MTAQSYSLSDPNSTAQSTASARSPRTAVAIGLLVAIVGLTLLAGGPGLLAGVALVLGWYGLELAPLHAVALGHVALAALAPPSLVSPAFAVAEVGFVIALFAPAVIESDRPAALLAASFVATTGFSAIIWLTLGLEPWAGAVILVLAFILMAYVLHRYELVRLDLVGGSG